jgi:hypothetical protein
VVTAPKAFAFNPAERELRAAVSTSKCSETWNPILAAIYRKFLAQHFDGLGPLGRQIPRPQQGLPKQTKIPSGRRAGPYWLKICELNLRGDRH